MPSPFVTLFLDYATETTLALVRTAVDAINAKVATAAKQDTGNASLASLDGKTVAVNTGAVVVSSSVLPTGAASESTLSTLNGKVTACNTGAVTVAASALPTGAALDATLTGGTLVAIAKGAAATGASPSGNPVYVAGIDGSSFVRPLLVSGAGNAQTSPAKGTSYSSAAAEISAVVSASACSPSMINVRNVSGNTRYVHCFNATSLPANGTVPVFMFMLTANSDQPRTFPIPTNRFSTGMTIAASSTAGTLTVSATSDFLIQVDLYPSST